MWRCSILLEVQLVNVSSGFEPWQYYVTKNFQVVVTLHLANPIFRQQAAFVRNVLIFVSLYYEIVLFITCLYYIHIYIYISKSLYVVQSLYFGSLLPKYRDCTTSISFEIYLMCCGVMLLLLIIYIYIYKVN